MAKENLDAYDDEFDEDEDSMEDMYLTFEVNEKDYGVDIKQVLEIVVLQSITEVPDMPSFVKGIINLRGKVIPLLDVRDRFRMQHKEYDERTCVVILDSNGFSVGLIVDAVNEVLKIVKDQMEPSPKIGNSYTSRFVDKVGKVDAEVKIILNLDRLLNEEELVEIKEMDSVVKKEEVLVGS